jgi:hypothetical protein
MQVGAHRDVERAFGVPKPGGRLWSGQLSYPRWQVMNPMHTTWTPKWADDDKQNWFNSGKKPDERFMKKMTIEGGGNDLQGC